jgi:hypothetical protein
VQAVKLADLAVAQPEQHGRRQGAHSRRTRLDVDQRHLAHAVAGVQHRQPNLGSVRAALANLQLPLAHHEDAGRRLALVDHLHAGLDFPHRGRGDDPVEVLFGQSPEDGNLGEQRAIHRGPNRSHRRGRHVKIR